MAAIFDTKCNNRVFHQKYNFNTLKNEESYTFLSIVNYYQLSNNDIVMLSRYVEGGRDERRKLRVLSSQIINRLCQMILSKEIKDYTSGMFIMERKVLLTVIPISYGHGEFSIEFIYNAHRKGLKILEVPHIQPRDIDKMSKTAPNIFRFFSLGFYYITRIFHSLFRRK